MPPVFISYSRKDFYFAESLAFHLENRGIASWLDANHLSPGGEWSAEIDRAVDLAKTFILVASPASVRSPYVQREWKLACAQGDRLIVALFRSCKLPAELQQASVVDFRGGFRSAMRRLCKLLGGTDHRAARLMISRVPRVPPWVFVITLMLASVFFLPAMICGDWHGLGEENESLGLRILLWLTIPFFFATVAWHACFAWLWRRMGMTRLLLTFLLFTGLFGTYLLGRTGWISALGKLTAKMHYQGMSDSILSGIVVIGCSALATIVLLRPEDLLRWCPTGKAWDSYRRGRVMKIPDLPTRFAELGRFQLFHDMEDAPAAMRLRADLLSLGANESAGDGTCVLLLTNRTRTQWLARQAELIQKGAVPVIGSAIGLPQSLQWLWRRQWIDLRAWNATHKQKNPVPAVPEGMTRLHLPSLVRVSEHLLCAIAGLLGVLANVAFPKEASSHTDSFTPRDAFGVVLAIACVCWVVAAWKLIHRTVTQSLYRRGTSILSWSTALLVAGALYLFVSLGKGTWCTSPALFFVLGLPFLLRWQTSLLSFWFPAPPGPGATFPDRLNAPRKWDALLWTFLYMGFWMVVLGQMD